jgi:hypothetical protein
MTQRDKVLLGGKHVNISHQRWLIPMQLVLFPRQININDLRKEQQ